ncbi:hypothetical protein SDC9_140189 [bioreactor metagenome]|uniref:Uncharacterized protein n=1 Tax=bioreactor metagenome TaxID=1076179 RepID=A0A645DWR2_9ZZZZ
MQRKHRDGQQHAHHKNPSVRIRYLLRQPTSRVLQQLSEQPADCSEDDAQEDNLSSKKQIDRDSHTQVHRKFFQSEEMRGIGSHKGAQRCGEKRAVFDPADHQHLQGEKGSRHRCLEQARETGSHPGNQQDFFRILERELLAESIADGRSDLHGYALPAGTASE